MFSTSQPYIDTSHVMRLQIYSLFGQIVIYNLCKVASACQTPKVSQSLNALVTQKVTDIIILCLSFMLYCLNCLGMHPRDYRRPLDQRPRNVSLYHVECKFIVIISGMSGEIKYIKHCYFQ